MNRITVAAAFVSIMAVAAVSGCGDSATAIIGTLPVVTGIQVDTLASRGDTIIVTWTPLDTTAVDGYLLWTRPGIEGPWSLAATTTTTAAAHIAGHSAYYTVMAYKGDDTSSATGLTDNTRAEGLTEIREVFSGRPVGFRIDTQGDSLIAGDPSDPGFNQQFTIAMNFALERFVFPGSAKPELWPGGARTRISNSGGFVAPSPGDTLNWDDSLLYGGNFFLELDNGHYCLLDGSQTLPDTVSMTDTLVIDGQIQPIMGVRVFNIQ